MKAVIISNVAAVCSLWGHWRNPLKSTSDGSVSVWGWCGTCSIKAWLSPSPSKKGCWETGSQNMSRVRSKCSLSLSQACKDVLLVSGGMRHFFMEASAGGACLGTWYQRVQFSSTVSQLETNGPGRRVSVRRSGCSSLCINPCSEGELSSGVSSSAPNHSPQQWELLTRSRQCSNPCGRQLPGKMEHQRPGCKAAAAVLAWSLLFSVLQATRVRAQQGSPPMPPLEDVISENISWAAEEAQGNESSEHAFFSLDYQHVQVPFEITLWIMLASLAKIGKVSWEDKEGQGFLWGWLGQEWPLLHRSWSLR